MSHEQDYAVHLHPPIEPHHSTEFKRRSAQFIHNTAATEFCMRRAGSMWQGVSVFLGRRLRPRFVGSLQADLSHDS